MNKRDKSILKMAANSRGVCFRVEENVAALKHLSELGYITMVEHGLDVLGYITSAGRDALAAGSVSTPEVKP